MVNTTWSVVYTVPDLGHKAFYVHANGSHAAWNEALRHCPSGGYVVEVLPSSVRVGRTEQ
jgi:hypothetical protein